MKKVLSLVAALLFAQASAVFAASVEDWSDIQPNKNTGAFADTNGSKIDFEGEAGPDGGKAIKLTAHLVKGGYCGIWHNIAADFSKSGYLKFKVKSSVAGNVRLVLKDAYNVQYATFFDVSAGSWTATQVPFSAFTKDTTYTPPDAIQGHPMDLSKTSGMNFQPQAEGDSVLEIGPIDAAGTAGAAPAAAAAAPAAATGPGLSKAIVIQDFTGFDVKNLGKDYGIFADSQGSTISVTFPPNKGRKMMAVTYSLKGDYCGLWCRAGGSDWTGSQAAGAKVLTFTIYSKQPVILGIALKDKNNNQYSADAPSTKGSGWEKIQLPLSSFVLDPYYTPPDAMKGAPMDFSVIKQFNIQPKTKGDKITFAVDTVTAQ